jgi:uncharacterized protein DUF3455
MHKLLTVGIAACAVVGSVGLAVAQMASATPKIDQLPDSIKPTGMSVFLEAPASGYQVYTCGKNQAGAWAWTLKAPDAELFDTNKKKIGKHYAGPTWEGNDGGKVVAAAKGNAPAPDGKSVAWLLLEVKSHDGNGQLTPAKAILRVNTSGGTAPTSGCDEAHANQENRVSYTATYLFLK